MGLAAASCTTAPKPAPTTTTKTKTKQVQPAKVTFNYTAKDRDCLKRAMYFESQHSDEDGYLAVGTVVMNRLTSGAYSDSICGIVGQKRQFAPGVMTREIKPQAEPELATAADAILHGERHPGVQDAMFFHTEGLKFPYDNMHYVAFAGGNAFYEKRGSDGALQTPEPLPSYEVAMNYVPGESMLGAPQFEPLLLPEEGPVPIPPPTDPTITTSIEPLPMMEPPMAVAIPTPRPDFANAVMRGGLMASGG